MEGIENDTPDNNEIVAEVQESNISFSSVDKEEEIVAPIEAPVETETTPEQQEVAPEAQEEEDEYETVELDEKTAWEFLKKAKGIEVDDFESLLTPKDQKKYAPEMEKFNEFIEKTGNKNFNDYLETQKDWSLETPENRLKSYLKLSNPELSQREVDRLYNKDYSIDGLDEEDDEDEILDRGIKTKTDLKRSDEFFAKRKEEFNAVGGSDEHIPMEYREAKQKLESQEREVEDYINGLEFKKNDFISKTENLLNSNFEGFKVQLGDDKSGFEDFTIKPENLNEVKESLLDPQSYDSQFFDPKTGELIKAKEYLEGQYMKQNYKAELNKAYARGRAKELEIQDRASKNIQPDNMREVSRSAESGIILRAEK